MKSLPAWIVQHRLALFIFSIAVILLAGYGGSKITFKSDYTIFFEKDNPQRIANEFIQEEFSSSDNVLFLVNPKNGDIFTRENLAAIESLTEDAWQIPYSQRVESITNHLYTHVDGDDLLVEFLIDEELNDTPADLIEKKAYAVDKVGVKDYLITREGDMSLVSVTLNLPTDKSGPAAIEVVDHVREFVKNLAKEHPEINFRVLGAVVMEVQLPKIVQEDGQVITPLATLLVFLFLIFVLRDLVGTFVSLMTCTLGIIAGMGAVLWTGVKISPILVNTPGIIMILGMANCIHLMVNYSQFLTQGSDKKKALEKSIEVNFLPIVFTNITTAISFLALNFAESPPFAHMGTAASAGILFVMIASLMFLPAMIYYLPSRASGVATMPRIGNLIEVYQQHGNKIVFVFVIVIVGLSALIPKNILDDNFIEFFDPDLEVRQDIELLTERISGSVVINISIPAGEEGGILNPEYLTLLNDLDKVLHEQPELRFATSLLEVMKTLNQNLHANDPSWYKVPDSRELASQYLLMYEMSLPFGQDLNNLMNYDRSESRVIAVYNELSDKNLITLENKIKLWLEENKIEGTTPTIGSSNLAFAHMQYSNVNSLSKGFVLALMAISVSLIFLFRSFSLGAVSVIPNLIPAAMAFGIWALINGKVGFGMSIGITLTLGIVVDDTIHFLSKYKYAKETLGYNNVESIRYAMDTVGIAMLLTTAMMSVAFGAMLFSNFTPNQDLGLITIITILCAVFVDLILLPIIMLRLFADKTEDKPEKMDSDDDSLEDGVLGAA